MDVERVEPATTIANRRWEAGCVCCWCGGGWGGGQEEGGQECDFILHMSILRMEQRRYTILMLQTEDWEIWEASATASFLFLEKRMSDLAQRAVVKDKIWRTLAQFSFRGLPDVITERTTFSRDVSVCVYFRERSKWMIILQCCVFSVNMFFFSLPPYKRYLR